MEQQYWCKRCGHEITKERAKNLLSLGTPTTVVTEKPTELEPDLVNPGCPNCWTPDRWAK